MTQQTVVARWGNDLSRAESARRVLEARRKKQKNDEPSASSATPALSSLEDWWWLLNGFDDGYLPFYDDGGLNQQKFGIDWK